MTSNDEIPRPIYVNYAVVNRVVDGDTWDCTALLPFGIKCDQRFRLHAVDTPETYRPKSEAEFIHGKQATEFVRNLIEGKTVLLKTHKLAVYGRYEAELWVLDENWEPVDSLADLLRNNGLLKLKSYSVDK